ALQEPHVAHVARQRRLVHVDALGGEQVLQLELALDALFTHQLGDAAAALVACLGLRELAGLVHNRAHAVHNHASTGARQGPEPKNLRRAPRAGVVERPARRYTYSSMADRSIARLSSAWILLPITFWGSSFAFTKIALGAFHPIGLVAV